MHGPPAATIPVEELTVVVCNCLAVNEDAVRTSIANGAASVNDVTDACEAGGGCGRCWPLIQALLAATPSAQDGCGQSGSRAA